MTGNSPKSANPINRLEESPAATDWGPAQPLAQADESRIGSSTPAGILAAASAADDALRAWSSEADAATRGRRARSPSPLSAAI